MQQLTGPRACASPCAQQPRAVSCRAASRRDVLSAGALLLTLSQRLPAEAVESSSDEEAVRTAVSSALTSTIQRAKAPAVLRLAFHDAGTFLLSSNDGGANGSLLYELERPESFGLKRGLKPVQAAQELLGGTAAERVSLADLIQLAGAHAVAITGGPAIRVPLGRLDAPEADPAGRMPEETLGGTALREHFARSGLTARELVALSGAHTIGGKGFGDPLTFDNAYYSTLLAAPWRADPGSHIGLISDRLLTQDAECKRWVEAYAADQQLWRADFGTAYLRMGSLGARWASGVAPPSLAALE
jgi:L-ascorbate peroxidase